MTSSGLVHLPRANRKVWQVAELVDPVCNYSKSLDIKSRSVILRLA
jgi:hypothetical protein